MAKYIHVQEKAFADTLRGMVLNKIWIFLLFIFHVRLYYSVLFIHCSDVITYLERADLLALLNVMLPCVFVTFPLRSQVRCGI